MRKKHHSHPPNLQPETEKDPGIDKLEELDQHIAERINQLGEPKMVLETPRAETALAELPTGVSTERAILEPPAERAILEPPAERFEQGFEAFEVFDYANEHRSESMRASYRDVSQSYQETAELMRNIHDLADLVTESIRQLNIRLNVLDESTGERTAHLDKSIDEMRSAIKEQQRLLKEAHDRLTAQTAAAPSDKSMGQSMGQLMVQMEKQGSFLESRIDRVTSELKHKLEEQRENMWGQFASKINAVEKESRDYLNRSLFSLAVLVVIIMFIAGAVIVNTLDHVCNYLTQSVDTLRVHMDQVRSARPDVPEQHPSQFSR